LRPRFGSLTFISVFPDGEILGQLETEVAKTGMVVGATSERPAIFAVRLANRKVIDTRKAQAHEAVFVEFPILISVRSEPIPGVIVPFVGKAHGDAIVRKSPEFLDQTIVEFLRPLARQKATISCRPLMNSARFLHRESGL
jgi:hypothetical protein